ncbi:MAG: hypothetical protein RLZZ283_393 [Candidatus Parcubacteria bacterium]|jgi:hypothetical protein
MKKYECKTPPQNETVPKKRSLEGRTTGERLVIEAETYLNEPRGESAPPVVTHAFNGRIRPENPDPNSSQNTPYERLWHSAVFGITGAALLTAGFLVGGGVAIGLGLAGTLFSTFALARFLSVVPASAAEKIILAAGVGILIAAVTPYITATFLFIQIGLMAAGVVAGRRLKLPSKE